jgi:hypothetical protein
MEGRTLPTRHLEQIGKNLCERKKLKQAPSTANLRLFLRAIFLNLVFQKLLRKMSEYRNTAVP